MSRKDQPFALKPFGNTQDPNGFYQLLLEHLIWLQVFNQEE